MLPEAKLLVLHVMTGLVFFLNADFQFQKRDVPLVSLILVGWRQGLENVIVRCAVLLRDLIQKYWMSLDQGPTLNSYFIMLIFYVALSYQ